MKRFFPSISKAQSEETAQSEEPPQRENGTETGSIPQSGPSIASRVANANTRLGVGMNVIISDPGLRTPIEDLDPNIQDVARREYVNLGPCQPIGHKYKRTPFGKAGRLRSFHDSWFKNHGDWLEYSVDKDAAFCFYCFLFKQSKAHNFGIESFTKVDFKNWKDESSVFNAHDWGT
jgi:hypothetical protein